MSSTKAISPDRHDVAKAISVFFAAINQTSATSLKDLILPKGSAILLDDNAADSAAKTTLTSLSEWADSVISSHGPDSPELKVTDPEIWVNGALAAAWVPVQWPVSGDAGEQVSTNGTYIVTLAKVGEEWLVSGVTEKKGGHAHAGQAQEKQDESAAEAMKVFEAFFQGLANQDAGKMMSCVIPEGRAVLIRGEPNYMTMEGVVVRMDQLFFGRGLEFEERCHDIEVRVEGRLCFTWSRFDIWMGKKDEEMKVTAEGCNVMVFLEVDGKWLIAGVADVNRPKV